MKSLWRLLCGVLRDVRRLQPTLRLEKGRLAFVLACSVLGAPLQMAGVGLLIPMLWFLQGDGEKVLASRWLRWLPEWFPSRNPDFYFAVFCGLAATAILAKNALLYVSQMVSARMLSRAGENLRQALFHRLQLAPLATYEEKKAGELTSLFTFEIFRATNSIDYILLIVQRGALGASMAAMILILSWQVTAAFGVLVFILAAVTVSIHRRIKRQGSERAEFYNTMGGFLTEQFSGVRVIRAAQAQASMSRRFDQFNNDLRVIERRVARYHSLLTPFAETFGVAGAMMILAGANAFLIRRGKLPAANLMGMGLLLVQLLSLVNQLQGLTGQLSFYYGGLGEMLRWLGIDQYPKRPFGRRDFPGLKSELRFERLSFAYPNGKTALDQVSFAVPAGATVAVVGASGSGKSTLASLLSRLREPTGGRIVVDGVDHWEFSPESWHRRLGVVEQEAFLFNDTLRRNLVLGLEGVPDARVLEALRQAHLSEVVAQLPQGLDNPVGERGAMLSGGQKQRLAIARALVRDPSLLILDEATSALDNVSERQVQAALDEARRGRTSLVIAHRLSTVRNADLIVVLDEGRVADVGGWAELEARPGAFQRLLHATGPGALSAF